jgi:peptidoglycan/LPS O-acetylase OafA/YrhL
MLESVVWGVAAGILVTIAAGIRRWPWRWCAVVGLGFALVLTTLRVATLGPVEEPPLLVLFGALGGSIAALGSERGERDRRLRSDAILGSRSATTASPTD